jgi:ubiquinone/menaquinone biosynthesis C-methylase UbiE
VAELPSTIARCPITHAALRVVRAEELATVNAGIAAGTVHQRDGSPVTVPLRAAVGSEDGAWLYRADEGIYALMAGLAVPGTSAPATSVAWRQEKQTVQEFYDEVGWKKTEDDRFEDTDRFLDTRSIVQDYYRECRLRIGRQLPASGEYLLDVASGPVQFPEYVDYQAGFGARICMDFSALALREARANVGSKGVLVQGDITDLPLHDDSIDAILSLHTIYHVPRDEQPTAFRELHRVLRPGGVAVVAYSWGHTAWEELSTGRRLLHLPARLLGRLRRALRTTPATPTTGAAGEPELYFHAFDHHWFRRQPWPFEAEIVTHHMFTSRTLEALVRERFLGARLLGAIRRFEDAFPRFAGRVGRYPLIVIRKR